MANPYLTRPKAVSPHAELEATLSQLRNRRREPQVVAMANQACYAGVVLKPAALAAAKAPATSRPAPAKPNVLAIYKSMPSGVRKAAFLMANAVQIQSLAKLQA
jgi:hypothetical protein